MLHYETVEPNTLELLKVLQSISELDSLRLVGGTALSLQIGHRKSIDLDLFGKLNIDEFELLDILNKIGETRTIKNSKNIKIYTVNGIKVDIVNYPYGWTKPVLDIAGIRLASVEDIATMKLAAITGRGTKKDFVDLFFLLKKFNFVELFDLYNKRFPDGSEFLVLKSLAYFKDADKDEPPQMLINTEWSEIKQTLTEKLTTYISTKRTG